MNFNQLPVIGTPLKGGIFAGLTTQSDGAHYAVILLADKPATRLAWQPAMDWAQSLGAALPTRPVAALLFVLLKDQFEEAWHWTSAQSSESFAWTQGFYHGTQHDRGKGYEARARAVRLIQLTA